MNPENDKGRGELKESPVAVDLTRLKNWSDFNENDYRDFSQQRAERRSTAHRRVEEAKKRAADGPPMVSAITAPRVDPAEAAIALTQPLIPQRLAAAEANVPLLTNPALLPARPAALPRLEVAPPVPAVVGPRAAVAVFSLLGGVGQSTLCAHLARSLYTSGERVLLADATGQSPLSLYFGSDEEREGLRQFCAPGEKHASVLVCHAERPDSDWLRTQVRPLIEIADRTIFDLGKSDPAVLEQVLGLCQLVLVPVTPGSHAIYGVQRLLTLLESLRGRLSPMPQVFLVLNRMTGSEEAEFALRAELSAIGADSFAPVALCESEDLAGAFSERMTLGDYHPSAPLAQQFERLAGWLRRTLPPSQPARAAME